MQFDLPAAAPPPGTPGWLRPLIEALVQAGPVIKMLLWAGLAAVVLLTAWGLYGVVRGHLARRRTPGVADAETGWRPDAAPARQLLAEADVLAQGGDYAEAAHLVLLRSIEQIARHRPAALRPASTSRDIAAAAVLPGDVSRAFGLIADVVEAGIFGGRAVSRETWLRCRAAYEDVAFPRVWA